MKKFIRMISLLLTFTLLLGLMVPASASTPKEVTYTTYQGYDIAILYNDVNGTAYQIEEDSLIYTLYVNKLTNELTLKAKNFKFSFLGMKFFPVTETYDVQLNSVEESGRVTASFVSQNNPDKVIDLDTSDAVAQFAVAIAAGVGLYELATGVCAVILLYYLLKATAIVIQNVEFTLVSDVIDAYKRYKTSIHYYIAVRHANRIWIGLGLKNDSKALSFARANLTNDQFGVFATDKTYARNLAKRVSPIGTASPVENHGKGEGYYNHYHPMKTAKKHYDLHIWYI